MAAHVHLCTNVVVEAEDWEGPDLRVCANTASMCRAFETSRPRESLSFSHHAETAALPPDEADAFLDWCEASVAESGKPPRPLTHMKILATVTRSVG